MSPALAGGVFTAEPRKPGSGVSQAPRLQYDLGQVPSLNLSVKQDSLRAEWTLARWREA